MTSLLIETILKTKSIVDYLASKGHHPVGGEVNGRLRYRCPLHLEKTPSFNVYTGGEYENFFCFGCKKRYNIIHLYRDMENVSIKDAIKSLGGDLNIDVESEINYAVQQIQNDHSLRNEFTPPELALMISRAAFDFLQVVELEKDYVYKVERMNQLVDKALDDGDMESLKMMSDHVPDKLAYLAVKRAEQLDVC